MDPERAGVGLATHLALIATRGEVVERGACIVARTPDDPDYHHGNLLVLPRPPRPGELPWALELFAREVGAPPTIRHVTLYWRAPDGAVDDHAALTAAGFELEVTHAMVAAALAPAAPPPGVELRPLAPDELTRAAELLFVAGDDERYRRFLHRRAAWQRDLVTRGAARFWGAFAERTLVGSLGVVRLGARARYQDVQTAASHRGRGIAAALLAAAGHEALAAGAAQLVIVAMAGGAGARLYARAGFRTVDRVVSACRPR